MRAREFVSEARRGKLDHSFQHTSPGTMVPKNHDHLYTSRSYDAYRVGVLTGMHEDDLNEMDADSWIGNMPMYNTYTPEEHDKVQRALKKLGQTAEHHAYQGSQEPPDTHKTSPVSGFKGYPK
jgi:hypothetical protein